MVMEPNYTLNLYYVLCVVIVLMVYPVTNYSAIVNLTNPANRVEKVEKPVAQGATEILHSELLFKYGYYNHLQYTSAGLCRLFVFSPLQKC